MSKSILKNKIEVSFCTVTYNSSSKIVDFVKNIESLKSNIFNKKIYVVDSGSTDGTVAIVEELCTKYDDVSLMTPSKNGGFGFGNNYVIPSLTSDYHVVINPDVEIPSTQTIDDMVLYMEQHKEVGLLSPKIMNTDGTVQKLYKHNPSILDMALRFISPNVMKKRQSWFVHDETGYTQIGTIDHASGACMFFRTTIFKKVGGFDERYFMYMEDADITREVNQVSKAVFYPKVSVVHEWQRESHKKFKYTMYTLKSMAKYFNKWGWKWM